MGTETNKTTDTNSTTETNNTTETTTPTTVNNATDTNKTPEAFTIKGDWNIQSRKLKETFSQLTDSDLKFEAGKENDLLSRVQTRLNKNREEVIGIIKKSHQTKG